MTEPTRNQPQGHSRREFIRRVLLATAYAAPAIVSLSVTGIASGQPADPGSAGSVPPGQAKMGSTGSPMSPMSPMRMMSPRGKKTKKKKGDPGDMWK